MIFIGRRTMDSISSYYYSPSTPMKNVFVGGLCVLAALLMCYRYQSKDHVVSFVAGACAMGVAIFPRTDPNKNQPAQPEINIGIAHWVFSIGFLLAIVIMVLYLFTLSELNQSVIQRGNNRFLTIVNTVLRPFRRSSQKTLPISKRCSNQLYLA